MEITEFDQNKDYSLSDLERQIDQAIRNIKALPISEADRMLRFEILDYAVNKLRQSRYEEDEVAEERWLNLINRIQQRGFSHVKDFDLDNQRYVEKEWDNLIMIIEILREKIENSFKITPQEKAEYLRRLTEVENKAKYYLDNHRLAEYEDLISEYLDDIYGIL